MKKSSGYLDMERGGSIGSFSTVDADNTCLESSHSVTDVGSRRVSR